MGNECPFINESESDTNQNRVSEKKIILFLEGNMYLGL